MSRRYKVIIPTALALAMAFGILLGRGLRNVEVSKKSGNWEKIDQILHYVESEYVDEVSRQELEEDAIEYLLQKLDPHSHYISGEELASVNESIEGSFQGIGVQFRIENDTVYVINTIAGGPSEKAGVMAGDKIIAVENEPIAGVGLANTDVMRLLKGPSGTEVNVTLKRGIEAIEKTIMRGEVALPSISTAYLLNDTTIYIKLDRFAKNSHEEFEDLVYPLKTQNTQHLILDLRGNGGGLLDVAKNIADEFLEKGKLITYTEGKSRPRREYYATSDGQFEEVGLSIIIDGYSASASEIIAGAMQDHKRAHIYGRRSFGKGLVQEQNEWLDGSATRLTIARYYTPNGRNIQREYESLSELQSADSLGQFDPRGGIEPDVQTLRDTAGITWLYAELMHRGLVYNFVYKFRDQNLESLAEMDITSFKENTEDSLLLADFRTYLERDSFEINENEWARSSTLIVQRIEALLVRSLYNESEYIKILNEHDPVIQSILLGRKNPESI